MRLLSRPKTLASANPNTSLKPKPLTRAQINELNSPDSASALPLLLPSTMVWSVLYPSSIEEEEEEPTKHLHHQTPSPKPKTEIQLLQQNQDFNFFDHLPDINIIPGIDDLPLPAIDSPSCFDSIQDWIDEMQGPEILGIGLETRIVDGSDGNLNLSEGVKYPDKTSDDGLMSGEAVVVDGEGVEMAGSLSSLIEERIGKVSLACDDSGSSGVRESEVAVMVKNEEVSESETVEEESSSSSESEDSGEEDYVDNDDDPEVDGEKEEGGVSKEMGEVQSCADEGKEDVEDGEILESDADKVVDLHNDDHDDGDDNNEEESMGSGAFEESILDGGFDDDDDDEGEIKGPIRSKNEAKELPPVPPVNVSLTPFHQMIRVGVVSSILGTQVIVEGMEKHNPLNEGSILWITEERSPLGIVDEIFGPVKNPYYIVRYNSESEVPSGIQQGTPISFVQEFADHILSDKSIYQKGYDASGENDEEEPCEVEFSDDEKEAEYRRMMKMTKRKKNQRPGNKESNQGNPRNRDRPGRKATPSMFHGSTHAGSSRANQTQKHVGPAPATSVPNSNQSAFRGSRQSFNSGTVGVSQCPPFAQIPSIQSQPQHMPFSQPQHMHGQNGGGPLASLDHNNPLYPPGFEQGFPSRPPAMAGIPQISQSGGIPPGASWSPWNQNQPQNAAFSNGIQMNPWLQQNALQALSMLLSNAVSLQQQFGPSQGFPPANTFPLGMTNPPQLAGLGPNMLNQVGASMPNLLGANMPNQVGANIPNQVGPNMLNQGGAIMLNQGGANIPNQVGTNTPNQVGPSMLNQFGTGLQWRLPPPSALGGASGEPRSFSSQNIPNQAPNGTGLQWQPPQSPAPSVISSAPLSRPSFGLVPQLIPQNADGSPQFILGASSNSGGRPARMKARGKGQHRR